MKDATTHVFICQSCLSENEAMSFFNQVKRLAAARWKKNTVRVIASGCFGRCTKQINCVIYPQGQWVSNLARGDELKLINIIEEALENQQLSSDNYGKTLGICENWLQMLADVTDKLTKVGYNKPIGANTGGFLGPGPDHLSSCDTWFTGSCC